MLVQFSFRIIRTSFTDYILFSVVLELEAINTSGTLLLSLKNLSTQDTIWVAVFQQSPEIAIARHIQQSNRGKDRM